MRIPDSPARTRVMMTFVNMHSPGLKILATHRLVSGLAEFRRRGIPAKRAAGGFQVRGGRFGGATAESWSAAPRWRDRRGDRRAGSICCGARAVGRARRAESCTRTLLGDVLGIGEEAVRDGEESALRARPGQRRSKRRGRGDAQVAFLLRADHHRRGGAHFVRRRRDAAEVDRFLSEAALRADDL